MITTIKVDEIVSVEKPIKYVCDKCGKELIDMVEIQNMFSIHFMGGYASIFGDLKEVKCDLCENCLYELIKDFYRTS